MPPPFRYQILMPNARNQRLISDSFAAAANDHHGIDRAARLRGHYVVKLNGVRFNSLRAAFHSIVNLLDPPRHLEDFHDTDILENETFRKFRDALNDKGLDIGTLNDGYLLVVRNMRYGHGRHTPDVVFRIEPWDGVKKDFTPYDPYANLKPRPLFY